MANISFQLNFGAIFLIESRPVAPKVGYQMKAEIQENPMVPVTKSFLEFPVSYCPLNTKLSFFQPRNYYFSLHKFQIVTEIDGFLTLKVFCDM